jgi:very-short-patch-repair endonuclease
MRGILGNKVRTIACVGCGLAVTRRMQPGQRFCSVDCYRASAKPTRKSGQERPCAVCGAAIYLNRARLKQATNFFCSPDHANEWQGRNKRAFCCKTCGKQFRKSPAHERQGRPTYCSTDCRDADPARRSRLIEMNVKQATLRPNALEKTGYALLDDLAIPHERQHLIGGRFCVDAFALGKLVIQFDGDYWHGNPDKFPAPTERQRRRMALDVSQDAYMAACGYSVIRIWESDLKGRPEHVRSLLQRAAQHCIPPAPSP